MTRKDYILLASAMHDAYRQTEVVYSGSAIELSAAINGASAMVDSISDVLGRDNPRFDREHFLAVVRGEKDLNSRPPRVRRHSKACTEANDNSAREICICKN